MRNDDIYSKRSAWLTWRPVSMPGIMLFLLFWGGLLFAGSRQLVLLGEPLELLDLLHAELAGNAEFSLLARAEIDSILREHQLNQNEPLQLQQFFPHADLLAVLSADAGRKPGRLLVFNARNGFRLADQSIPAGAPDAVISNIAANIRASVQKVQKLKSHYVAINLVRLVAIDSRQSDVLQGWLRRFASELLQHPDIQLLERDNLGQVLTERELTGQRFSLTPSTRLLTYEFETGESVEVIKVTLYCHDLDGRELRRLVHQDILAEPQRAIRQMIAELHAALSELPVPLPVADASQQEAENFYASSLKAWNPQEALARIEAAVALAPDNETYRYAEILAYAGIASFPGHQSMLDHVRNTFERIRRFQKDFPQCRQPFFPRQVLVRWWTLASLYEYLLDECAVRYRDDEALQMGQLLQELSQFYADVRPAVQQDLRRLPQYAFDFSDGLQDIGEGRRFESSFMLIFNKYPLYVQRKEKLIDCFAAHLEYLRVLDLEYRRDPALAEELNVMPMDWIVLLREAKDRQAFIEFFREDKSFLTFLDNSALPAGRMLAGEIRVVLKLLQNRPYRDKVRQIYLEYFAGVAAENPDCFANLKAWRQRLSIGLFPLLNRECYSLPDHFAWVCLEEFLGHVKSDAALDCLDNALFGRGDDKQIQSLLEVATELSTLGGACLKQYRVANAFRDLSFLLWERKQADLPEPLKFLKLNGTQEQLLCSLNRNFNFHHGRFDEALAYGKPLLCIAACRDGSGVLLLLGEPGGQTKMLLARISADGSMSMLPEVIDARQPLWFDDSGGVGRFVLLCDQQHIMVIVEGRGFLIKRQQGIQPVSFSVSHDRESSHVLLENRLYILDRNSLHSMSIDGEQRRLHFSQDRLHGTHALEKEGNTRNLVTAKNGDLFFLAEFPAPGKGRFREEIWRFDPRKEVFDRVIELPAGQRHALQQGESLPQVLRLDRRTCTIFQMESTNGGLRELARFPDKDKFRLARFHGNEGDFGGPRPFPFLLRDGCFWAGGLNPACVNLANPDASPLLWLPVTDRVFALEKEVLFLRHNYWFRLSLPDRVK